MPEVAVRPVIPRQRLPEVVGALRVGGFRLVFVFVFFLLAFFGPFFFFVGLQFF